MKKVSVFVSAVFVLILSGCSTLGFGVPGETRILLKNIAVEYDKIADGYVDIKNYTKAAEYYQLAMRNKELKLTVSYKLARAYALGKDYEKALESYNALLELDPENVMLKTSIAYIYAMMGETDESLKRYKVLMDENPYNESLMENYVALLINIGRGEDAETYYYQLKERFPDNKQITTFTQKLSDMIDNFDPNKKAAEGDSTASKSN